MADLTITLTIPDAKVSEATDGLLELFPIPVGPDGTPEFDDDAEWIQELMRRAVRDMIARGAQAKARKAINFAPDDTIVTRPSRP